MSFIALVTKRIMNEEQGNAAFGIHFTVKSRCLTNKMEHFSFKSGCTIRVAKHLKEDWLTVL